MHRTLTIKQVIQELKKFKPNTPVLLAGDEEGNSFGTLNPGSFDNQYDKGKLIIFPWEQFIAG